MKRRPAHSYERGSRMAREVELITPAARGRRYTPEEKAKNAAETLEVGATVAVVARGHHDFPACLIFAWRRAMTAANPSDRPSARA